MSRDYPPRLTMRLELDAEVPPIEACARCGQHFVLERVGKLWLQPAHDCRTAEEMNDGR